MNEPKKKPKNYLYKLVSSSIFFEFFRPNRDFFDFFLCIQARLCIHVCVQMSATASVKPIEISLKHDNKVKADGLRYTWNELLIGNVEASVVCGNIPMLPSFAQQSGRLALFDQLIGVMNERRIQDTLAWHLALVFRSEFPNTLTIGELESQTKPQAQPSPALRQDTGHNKRKYQKIQYRRSRSASASSSASASPSPSPSHSKSRERSTSMHRFKQRSKSPSKSRSKSPSKTSYRDRTASRSPSRSLPASASASKSK
jgi:hypothetical protein